MLMGQRITDVSSAEEASSFFRWLGNSGDKKPTRGVLSPFESSPSSHHLERSAPLRDGLSCPKVRGLFTIKSGGSLRRNQCPLSCL
jgi:hypothetical protein